VFTTIFLPVTSDIETPQSKTIPIRIFCLFVSVFTICLNFNLKKKHNIFIILLVLFWFLYFIKLFIVISITGTVAEQYSVKYQYYMYAIGIFIPFLSIIWSYKKIDIKKLFWYVYFSGIFILIFSTATNMFMGVERNTDILQMRLPANLALNAISYGHIAITIALLSIYALFYLKTNLYRSLLYIVIFIFSLFVSFTAGSRSPIVAFIFVGIILFCMQRKSLYILISSIMLFSVFSNTIFKFIEQTFPVMYIRLDDASRGDTSERNLLYHNAWRQFINAPWGSDDFVLNSGYGKGMYPHNIILESLVSLGITGGIIIILLLIKSISKSIVSLKKKSSESFLVIIFLQYVILYMFSYSLYSVSASVLFCLMTYILLTNTKNKNI
jgi:O-antigen ligase